MQKGLIVILVLSVSACVWAIGVEPIGDKSGFDGSFDIGAAWLKVRSNSFVGTNYQTLTSKRNHSLTGKPDSEDNLTPMIGLKLNYTFPDTQTQLFLGSTMFDRLNLDRVSAVGLRQELADESILEGSFLFSALSTEVWTDPFVTGSNRRRTDRQSTGGRIAWGRMFGTGLQIQYSYRDIDIDHETSGQSLGLTAAQQSLLDRNGDHHQAELLYIHPLADNQWIAPTIRYNRYDLDGKAMANDSYELALTHIYAAKTFRVVTSLSGGFDNYDQSHPVFGKKRKDESYGVSTALICPDFLNNKNMTGNIGLGYFRQNSNMAFYDEEMIVVSVGTTYSF